MDLIKPKGWREGQTIFNFLEWLHVVKGVGTNQNYRMADPFHISDEYWDKCYEEFLEIHGIRPKSKKGKMSDARVPEKK